MKKNYYVSVKALVARTMAVELMREHGLVGWQFQFDDAARRVGICHYPNGDRPGRICLSVYYVENNSEEEVRDTILHEIAHALVGPGHGHDETWRRKCVEIGAKPERCCGAEVATPPGSWQATCPLCRRVYHRHRRPRTNYQYSCLRCLENLVFLKSN